MYLEPEWNDDSWNGNCPNKNLLGGYCHQVPWYYSVQLPAYAQATNPARFTSFKEDMCSRIHQETSSGVSRLQFIHIPNMTRLFCMLAISHYLHHRQRPNDHGLG